MLEHLQSHREPRLEMSHFVSPRRARDVGKPFAAFRWKGPDNPEGAGTTAHDLTANQNTGNIPLAQTIDLVAVDIDARSFMANIGKTKSRGDTNIPGSDDTHIHMVRFALLGCRMECFFRAILR